jgi:hypothetical protein
MKLKIIFLNQIVLAVILIAVILLVITENRAMAPANPYAHHLLQPRYNSPQWHVCASTP